MFDSLTYQKRRKALREKMSNGIILILGNNEAPANYPDNTYKFRQDSSFVYFFGHSHPGYAGIIDIDNDKDYFFGNDVDHLIRFFSPVLKSPNSFFRQQNF